MKNGNFPLIYYGYYVHKFPFHGIPLEMLKHTCVFTNVNLYARMYVSQCAYEYRNMHTLQETYRVHTGIEARGMVYLSSTRATVFTVVAPRPGATILTFRRVVFFLRLYTAAI